MTNRRNHTWGGTKNTSNHLFLFAQKTNCWRVVDRTTREPLVHQFHCRNGSKRKQSSRTLRAWSPATGRRGWGDRSRTRAAMVHPPFSASVRKSQSRAVGLRLARETTPYLGSRSLTFLNSWNSFKISIWSGATVSRSVSATERRGLCSWLQQLQAKGRNWSGPRVWKTSQEFSPQKRRSQHVWQDRSPHRIIHPSTVWSFEFQNVCTSTRTRKISYPLVDFFQRERKRFSK